MGMFDGYTDEEFKFLLSQFNKQCTSFSTTRNENGLNVEYRFQTELDKYVVVFEPYKNGYKCFFCLDDGKYDTHHSTGNLRKYYYEFHNIMNTIQDILLRFQGYYNPKSIFLVFEEDRIRLMNIVMDILNRQWPYSVGNDMIYHSTNEINEIKLKIYVYNEFD